MAGTPINPIDFFQTVYTRLAADSTLTGIVAASKILAIPAPEDTSVTAGNPIRVLFEGTIDFNDVGRDGTTFTSLGMKSTLQIRVQWHRESGPSDAATVMNRIMGDYDPSAQTAATYGINVWTPSLSGWGFQPWRITEQFMNPLGDAVIEGVMTFECTGQMS